MYEAQLPKDWTHILNDSQCQTLFASTEEIYLKIKKEVLPSTPLLNEVICLDGPKAEPNSFEGLMEEDREMCDVVEPTQDDLANLIYTSGTTGKPKGVELIHTNQVSNIKAGRNMVVDPADFIQSTDRSLAFLPWAHSYGQTCELWCLLSQGASMGICRGIPNILEDLQLVQPTLLFAVPTLYKRVHDGVINMMNHANPIQQKLMRSALRLGKAQAASTSNKRVPPLGFVDGLKYKFIDDAVLSKIRARFGGNLRAGFVAGAACPKEIIDFMDAIGIPVCEGYGLTETSPVISMNVLGNRKAGAVGRVLDGVTVHILDPEGNSLPVGEEGEICCSGPNVMKGYYNNEAATDEVISLAPDGSRLFHTGDLGKLDSDGFLNVTGRIKEQYKLENGKYVCPTPIEQAIGMSRFISQVVVCGANRPYNVALVVPDWVAVRSELGISNFDASEEDLVNDTRVKGLISAEIKLNCYNIKKFEVPKAWACVAPFTAANNMVTPKMSIRRHVVIKTYDDIISNLYEGNVETGGLLSDKQRLEAA
jgi:long-chain acyl-CoA synthetase